jgi:SAM-dependent methyltransferase
MNLLPTFIRRLWFSRSAREKARADKEQWEFDWQRTHWADLYASSEVREKAREYWRLYRHLDDIRNKVQIRDDTLVLDVGCGISSVLHYLPGRRYGIDPLADRYRSIYQYPGDLTISVGYGESIPFERDYFDVVFCSNVIDHTEDPQRTVAEMWRVTKPTGHVVLTCEVFESEIGARNAGHPFSVTVEELRRLGSDFTTIDHWESPWYGLRGYVLGHPPTAQREHIFLLRK